MQVAGTASSTNLFSAIANITTAFISSLTAATANITNLVASTLSAQSASIGSLNLGAALGIASGGTGITTAPTPGQILVGNSSGGYTLTSTSSLGFSSAAASSSLLSDSNTWSGTQTLANLNAQSASIGSLSGAAFSSLTSNYLPKWNAGTWSNSLILDNGTGVAIGTTSLAVGTSSAMAKLAVNGPLYLSGPRSTLFFRGDDTTDQLGGLQIDALNYGTLDILTPTNNSGTTLNSTLQLGGNGNFNNNIVNLTVTGTTTALQGFSAGPNTMTSTGGFQGTNAYFSGQLENARNISFSGPWAASQTAMYLNNSAGGAIVGGGNLAPLNFIAISGDTVNATATAIVDGLNVSHNFGGVDPGTGVAASGGRTGIQASLNMVAPTANNTPNTSGNYVGVQSGVTTSVNDNGTLTTPLGALFGFSSQTILYPGATNYLEATGGEINLSIHSGASAWYKALWTLVADPGDSVQGSVYDTMLGLSNQTGAIGFQNGILFGPMNGTFPLTTTGTMIAATGTAATKNGIDFSTVTFSGDFLKSKGFVVDGNGAVNPGSASYFGAALSAPTTNGISLVPAVSGQRAAIQGYGVDATRGLNIQAAGAGLVAIGNATDGAGFQVNDSGGTAANYVAITGGTTGQAVSIAAGGSDSNIGINYFTKGTGAHYFAGNVGIGTSIPSSRLQVKGPDSSTTTAFSVINSSSTNEFSVLDNGNIGIGTSTPLGRLSITGSGTGSAPDFVFADSGNNPQFVIQDNGYVGIGTTSPFTNLSVNGNAFLGGTLSLSGAINPGGTTYIGAALTSPTTNGVSIIPNVSGQRATIQGYGVDATRGLNIQAAGAGLVAIGNATDGDGLQVNDPGGILANYVAISGSQTSQLVALGAAGSDTNIGINYFTKGTGAHYFVGNVGIGTASPTSRLQVKGPDNASTSVFSVTNASSTNEFTVLDNGNIGVGTTNPYSRLQITGPDSASTTAFAVVNSASTTVFASYDNGNATYSGSLFQSSDQRLKTNIASLDSSSSLSLVDQLNPVSYTRIDQPDQGSTLGFIAQEVQKLFPNLVTTTAATALTPGGTLTLNYTGLIAPLVAAVQALQSEIASIQNTVAGFAQSFTSNDITANQQLCVKNSSGIAVCVTGDQLAALLASSGGSARGAAATGISSSAIDTTSTPPVIQVNGDNPAIIQIGTTYSDLGATITGPAGDANLGIRTFVNGAPMSPVQIDTSAAATDTIDYVATDQNGLTSTSTRTVIIQAPATQSSTPTSTPATTTATSI